MSRSRVASQAMKWVIWKETSGSVDRLRPTFEEWILADREHWVAYIRAREEWKRWRTLAARMAKDRNAVSEVQKYIERRKTLARAHRQFLWAALSVSVLILMVV